MYKVVIVGVQGKMGQIAVQAIEAMPGFSIVGKAGRKDNLKEVLNSCQPDIAIELTSHESVLENTWCIVKNGVRPIVGSSGLSQEEIKKFVEFCSEKKLGGLIIPNFSIAFACIHKISKELSQYYEDISIVEYHHAQKKDKPSGTARHTAAIVGLEESKIASVRGNGFLAKQQIYFHSEGERILIDHESFSRNSFQKGIQLCANKVVHLNSLIVGLENIIAP